MKIPISIDSKNQIFATLRVVLNKASIDVRFKIDTGCNVVLLSRSTLADLGFATSHDTLLKLPIVQASVGDGSKTNFRQAGLVALYSGNLHISSVPVICHTTKNTRDLLGTSVLHKFSKYTIHVKGKMYLELAF